MNRWLLALPLATVHDAKVVSFDPQQERVGGWATAGSISTLSHGVGLLISAPVWIVSGVAMTSGQGCVLEDADGREYLDFMAGVGVASLGHSHPHWISGITAQASKLVVVFCR